MCCSCSCRSPCGCRGSGLGQLSSVAPLCHPQKPVGSALAQVLDEYLRKGRLFRKKVVERQNGAWGRGTFRFSVAKVIVFAFVLCGSAFFSLVGEAHWNRSCFARLLKGFCCAVLVERTLAAIILLGLPPAFLSSTTC